MDSMVGYKNDKYINFGRAAARLDDFVNFIPSRLAALLMTAAAWLLKFDYKNAFKIWRRDRFNHASPNSAQTESVCAGALNVRLAGDAYYFGKLYKKEFIGDDIRKIEPEDIKRANNLMYAASVIMLVIAVVCKLCLWYVF
jgi:adenosylcobinamide-phosphate synthase